MDTCYYCGELIEFRYVGGAVVPIHISGNWCPAASGRPPADSDAVMAILKIYIDRPEELLEASGALEADAYSKIDVGF
jgi:hypothetical protein